MGTESQIKLCTVEKQPIFRSMIANKTSGPTAMLDTIKGGAENIPPIPLKIRATNAGRQFLEKGNKCNWFGPFPSEQLSERPMISRKYSSASDFSLGEEAEGDNVHEKKEEENVEHEKTADLEMEQKGMKEEVEKKVQKEEIEKTDLKGELETCEKDEAVANGERIVGDPEAVKPRHSLSEQATQYGASHCRLSSSIHSTTMVARPDHLSETDLKEPTMSQSNTASVLSDNGLTREHLTTKLKQHPVQVNMHVRRLHGSLAKKYALRNEGCIDKLMYSNAGEEFPSFIDKQSLPSKMTRNPLEYP